MSSIHPRPLKFNDGWGKRFFEPHVRTHCSRNAPGRARLATSPDPTGSETATMTIGIVPVASLAARDACRHHRNNDVDLERDQLCCKLGKPFELPFREAALDDDVLSLHIAKLTQPAHKCIVAGHGSG